MTTLRTPQTDLTTKRTRRRPSSRKMSSLSHITPRAGDSDFTANDPQQSPGRNSCMDPTLAYAKQSASHTNAKAKHLRHHAARDTQLVRRRHNPSYRRLHHNKTQKRLHNTTAPTAPRHGRSTRHNGDSAHSDPYPVRATTRAPQHLPSMAPHEANSHLAGKGTNTSAPLHHSSTRSKSRSSPSQQGEPPQPRTAGAAATSRHCTASRHAESPRTSSRPTRRAAPMPAAASTKPARPALPHRSPTTSKPDLARARPRTQAPAHKATAAATTRHFGVASAPSRPSRRHCCLANPCRETCGAARNRARMLQPSLDEPRRRRKRTGFARR